MHKLFPYDSLLRKRKVFEKYELFDHNRSGDFQQV